MDFFEHQDQARRNTTKLILLFGLAIASMIMAFYLVAIVTFQDIASERFSLIQPGLFVLVAIATLSIIGVGSLTKMVELRRGGAAVAESLGGRKLAPQTEDFKETQLLNVVAEMALASGTPVPTVYLLEREQGINAFAAGYSPDDAVIGVTQGCIEQLTREELQGVIAHEFSHIINGDMRLNLKLIGVLQGLLYIYILGRILLDSTSRSHHHSRRSNDNEGGSKLMAFGLAMIVIGGIGLIFGRLIKSGVSRQREFLADASSVQFTRNPNGIAGALRRIGGFTSGSKLRSPKAEEASHMFFGEALNPGLMDSWMATHPPLQERIRRITGLKLEGMPAVAAVNQVASAEAMGFSGGLLTNEPSQSASMTPSSAASVPAPDQADQFMATVGTATPQNLAKVHAFLDSLPADFSAALHTPDGAMALVYSLLLDQKAEVRSRQLAQLETPESLVTPQRVEQVSAHLHRLDGRTYLSLLDLSIPALRTITKPQCAHFFKQIQAFVRADGKLSLSEYVLQLILQKRLRPHFKKEIEPPKPIKSLNAVWSDCTVLMTILARIGHSRSQDAFYAFKAGMGRLPGAARQELPQALPNVTLNAFGQSLKRLEAVVPKLKQGIVDAAAHTVMVDNEVTLREAELLRAIVIALDCPIPPFLDASARRPQRPKRQPTSTPAAMNGRG